MKKFISRLRVVFHVRRFVPFLFDFFTSKEVSIKKKILSIAFLVGYVAMPLDLIPDFLPFIGILDDIGIVLFILNRIVKMAPVQLQEKHNVNVG
ncbi:YkvA family protein [Bacillus sp. NPDC094077]|uniref:YkvA family protein n=1 Tax=Bacillus sp. NPDC094077 TaxID=3390932 RepID=UPI003D064617